MPKKHPIQHYKATQTVHNSMGDNFIFDLIFLIWAYVSMLIHSNPYLHNLSISVADLLTLWRRGFDDQPIVNVHYQPTSSSLYSTCSNHPGYSNGAIRSVLELSLLVANTYKLLTT